MTRSSARRILRGVVAVLLGVGCTAGPDDNATGPVAPMTNLGGTPGVGGSPTGAVSTGANGNATSSPGGGPAKPAQTDVYSEASVRRMTVREFANTVTQLLGTERDFSRVLPHDVTQQGYSRNQAQAVDPVFGRQLQQTAEELAAAAVAERLPSIAPCSSSPGPDCAKSFIRDFGQLAYRRPLGEAEQAQLLTLYELAAEGRPDPASQFASGVQFLLEAMLQAPSFLYISGVGELAEPGAVTALDHWEIASALSYLVAAGPPDEALRADAAAGQLSSSAQRRAHAARLVSTPAGQAQVRSFVREWLHLDKVATIDKLDPRFAELRKPMLDEANDFIDEVTLRDDGTLAKLLTAGYTVVGPELAAFYGVSTGPDGRASLAGTGRLGILQQGAFLSANSAANLSSPIQRAAVLLDRVTCVPSLPPSFSGIVVKQPAPDPNSSTRERFAAHAKDPTCQACHQRLDGAGFLFENFGPIGELRSEEAGKPIDTSGELKSWIDVDGLVADSVELSQRLARSADIKRCFAKQVYRYAAAADDFDREDTFVRGLEAEGALSDQVHSLLVSFAASNSFLMREHPAEAGATD